MLESLTRIYHLDANIGFLQEGHALAESYGSEFYRFIEESIAQELSKIEQVTEIGCGGGYILKNFKNSGKKVRGIDPSPLAFRQSEKFGFEMIQNFYPLKEKITPSDLIFHYDVLEHVTDPLGFLKAHYDDLNEGGFLIAGMPDVTESIAYGDISMAMHEHLNYFDTDSLRHALALAGFSDIRVETSKHGGLLFCCARKRGAYKNTATSMKGKDKLLQFVEKAHAFIRRVQHFIEQAKHAPESSFGFYVPLRAFPYMSYLNFHDTRLFDDSASLYHRYYDGCPIQVENFENLCSVHTTHILVASFPFGEIIRKKIVNRFGDKIKVATLSDFKGTP